ncbi:MAG: alpha/beta hydrolase [Planctomycetes bacterium]|nr:alpha/beta hydrolase [Planctomycetota bacterium]
MMTMMLALALVQDRLTEYRTQLQQEGVLREKTVDGYRLCYAEMGEGKAVVLLHGLSGSLYDWRGNQKPLAAGYRVIALDMLGAGESDMPEKADYGLQAQARRVKRFMDEMGIERATLVGNSYGGGVALAFAQDWPERLDRLVLIDTICYPEEIPAYVKLCDVPCAPEQIVRLLPVGTMVDSTLRKCYGKPGLLRLGEIETYTRELDSTPRRQSIVRTVRAMKPDDATEFLARLKIIRARTLILWGEKDLTRPVEHGQRLAKELPDARLEVLADVAHLPNQEVPERVNALILEFLK